ncbi:MAG: bifunctional folylpolyglutamate synthase/dihydrofolate synthase [Pseudomonadales bacterium]|nr:bifunctional folylpolyglutamate synthase/dihydrofolate synthase [Pseudomonadales bacterium]
MKLILQRLKLRWKPVPEMTFDTLAAWLQWLEQQHCKEIDMGLSRVAEVATRLKVSPNYHKTSKIITVAGTNGKGSFITTLQALLLEHGNTVATYTSPHLINFNERMVINGLEATDTQIMAAFERVHMALDGVSLSYFEYTTLAAMVLFQSLDVDYCLFEVGLGGRLDAVNILVPDYAVITSIGIDHCEYLGHTLDSIAAEKCGILRQTTPLICAEAQAPDVLIEACERHESGVINQQFSVQSGDKPGQWYYRNLVTDTTSMALLDNGLSLSSQSAAIYLAQQLLVDQFKDETLVCLEKVFLAGRFQRFNDNGVDIILDVAHNVQAVALLKQRLNTLLPLPEGKKRIAVFAMLEGKDVSETVALLKDDVKAWFVADLKHERAISASDLAAQIHEQGIHMISVSKNIRQAFARAKTLCEAGDQIVVLGSFFTVAEVLPRLQRL